MPDNGCTCGESDRYLAVVDKNLEPNYKAGNKYCRYCPACGRRKYCSEQFFEQSGDQFAIPQGEKQPIPLTECPSCGEECPVDEECRGCGDNVFNCPKCGVAVGGTPDACPECGAKYQWE